MKKAERAFHEFIDAVYIANTKEEFQRVGQRAAHALGFRWFAYYEGGHGDPTVVTSYPKSWVDRYGDEQYQNVDPVLRQARAIGPAFLWDGSDAPETRSMKERRFFDDALSFKIRTGVTVPIAAGYGRFGAFTFAGDDRSPALERLAENSKDLLQMMGVSYHAHVKARMTELPEFDADNAVLTFRERQCLGWASSGKTMQEMATILRVTPRVVKFHLDNGRRKLGASTLTHAVALALRRELLP
jgi:LuxR family transcriptional regulator, activator of conjugal transfer of Ti plasmids